MSTASSTTTYCPGPFELDAYRVIRHECMNNGLQLDFNDADASKLLLKVNLKGIVEGMGQEFRTQYVEAAKNAGKGGTFIDDVSAKVEFDFVAYVSDATTTSVNLPRPSMSGGGSSAAASPIPSEPTNTRLTLSRELLEKLQGSNDDPKWDAQRRMATSFIAPQWRDLDWRKSSVEFGYLDGAIFRALPPTLQSYVCDLARGREPVEMLEIWKKECAQVGACVLQGAADKLRRALGSVGLETKAPSPETEARRVVLFEIKESGAVLYALYQLELRLAVYLDRRRQKSNSRGLGLLDVVAVAGLHVQPQLATKVREMVAARLDLRHINTLACNSRFLLTHHADRRPQLTTAALEVVQGAVWVHVWVKYGTAVFRVTPTDIYVDSLKDAVKAKMPNTITKDAPWLIVKDDKGNVLQVNSVLQANTAETAYIVE